MRVISGTARGTKLKTLSGTDVVRPTTDRVKESLFNIIQFSIHDAYVLDLFCGSGALGIESLSRNASHCDFVDSNTHSIDVTRFNVSSTHLTDRSSFYKSDFEAYIKSCKKRYDLIFADPPYNAGFLPRILVAFEHNDILSENGLLIAEASVETESPASEFLELFRTAVYGKTKILFYKKG